MNATVRSLEEGALEIEVRGKLERADYDAFVPRLEECIAARGKVALLVRLADFEGWSPAALWEDLKFDARHYHDVSRVALVGSGDLERWMATLSKPFTDAEVRFFPHDQLEPAREWIRQAAR